MLTLQTNGTLAGSAVRNAHEQFEFAREQTAVVPALKLAPVKVRPKESR
jgi:hypothetical protein